MLDRIKFTASLLVLLVIIIACSNKSTTQNSGTENTRTQPNTRQTPPVETKKGQTAQTIEGKGTKTQFVELNSGLAIFEITFKGGGHFGVWLKDSDGNNLALLANTIGTWSGSTSEKIPQTGKYVIDVSGTGTWSISIK